MIAKILASGKSATGIIELRCGDLVYNDLNDGVFDTLKHLLGRTSFSGCPLRGESKGVSGESEPSRMSDADCEDCCRVRCDLAKCGCGEREREVTESNECPVLAAGGDITLPGDGGAWKDTCGLERLEK